jgi:hypothetical protein
MKKEEVAGNHDENALLLVIQKINASFKTRASQVSNLECSGTGFSLKYQ